MESKLTRMKQTLERTARLGLDVLQRAKSHEVNWSSVSPSISFRDRVLSQEEVMAKKMKDELGDPRFEASFASVADLMAQIAAQCERFCSNVPTSECDTNEVNHIYRYHTRNVAEKKESTADSSKDLKTFATPTHQRNAPKRFKFEGTCTFTECPERDVEDTAPDRSLDSSFSF
nr:A-kinase-interacting protein 1 isoform X2 [Geotrypetes seraphini]XP_033784298.1 A-kinase-interacting protein 1 isoform X2 [Geotrypetes seraphini]XP_033784299.1 A-kinase-interacting protein 1 isoform X2 [Geotrypetes seraphini]